MREAPLPDIIQLVSQGGKSGCFHIMEDPKRAKTYLKDGRISHAVTNDAVGLDAVYEVALWLDGHYHFEEGDQGAPVTITKSNATVLMEMHRRMDEWRVINQKISSLDLYPNSTLLPGETPHGVSPREAKLLSLVTGFYSVAELAEVLQKPILTVAKDVYGLIMAGHVVLKGLRSGRRPELPPELTPKPAEEEVPQVAAPVAVQAAPIQVPVPEPVPAHKPNLVLDPVKMAKLNAFNQRIVQAAKSVLPSQHHEMVNNLYAKATQQVMQGDGPEAVKSLALAISRNAVDAGCEAGLVKDLNAHLKALFSK
ncbi:MAG TPA: DUF4388 domain-containing protein [Holophaga sp.]|nr:DUF4388 domain-containing protein [Holophaga sp.]